MRSTSSKGIVGDLSPHSQSDPGMTMSTEFYEEKGVREMLKSFGLTEVPDYYIQPTNMRVSAVDAETTVDAGQDGVPLVDLHAPHEELLRTMAAACKWGFFQIINHGTPSELLEDISNEAEEFFALPLEEKARCTTSAKVRGPVHFGGGSKGDWRDVLKLQCAPPSEVALEFWPRQPLGFREIIMRYSNCQLALAMRLMELISESLGLEKGYIREICQYPRVLLALNNYPPCPDPTLTIGIREHSDPNTITVLLQDQVAGLQVYKGDRWINVKPLAGALLVNAGDHLQILSNGRCRSCVHRVVNNKSTSRTSIAMFVSPSMTSYVGPAPGLVDQEHPARYHKFLYADFLKDFYLNGGPNKQATASRYESSEGSYTTPAGEIDQAGED